MRGVIRNRDQKRNIIDFDGLVFGKISPTDIDGFIDFGNKLFVFVETKHGNTSMPTGQRLALERLCDATHNPPHRYSVAFVTNHESDGDIDLANTVISKYRWNKQWLQPREHSILFDGVEHFRKLIVNF